MRRGVNEETARAGERDFSAAAARFHELEEETAVLIYSGATTSTRTRACQKTPRPIIHPVVCVGKLSPVINRGGGLAQNGGPESQKNERWKVSSLLHEEVG